MLSGLDELGLMNGEGAVAAPDALGGPTAAQTMIPSAPVSVSNEPTVQPGAFHMRQEGVKRSMAVMPLPVLYVQGFHHVMMVDALLLSPQP